MLDDRTAADRSLDPIRHFVWDNDANRTAWRAYLEQEPGLASARPYAVPARRSDLSGLPPAWIGAGEIELFFNEDRAYAEAHRAAGVECVFDAVPGAPHAFETLAGGSPVARAYVDRACAWLGEHI